ncbi:MAG: outer membrane beta-barrel protein [Bryobacteraceae bacterium]|nr:outer membrane beta-barrel protein [Bryobacteraceae bacterium]
MRFNTQSSLRPRVCHWTRALTVAALILAIGGFTAAPAQSGGDERPDMVEINLFGGGSFFRGVSDGLGTKHHTGGAFGIRVTENFWRYVGLEQGFTYSVNNLMFQRPSEAGAPNFGFGSRLFQYNLNPVFHFTPKGSNVRPYVTVGISALDWRPTDRARAISRLPENVRFGATTVRSNLQAGVNYGGGVKMHLTDHIGLRFDARAITSRNPTYGLPDHPGLGGGGVYIPARNLFTGFQTTAGINFYIGRQAAPAPPPPPPAPRDLGALNAGRLDAGTGTLCQGRAITIRSVGASDPAGRQMTYKWKVNGQPMGGNSPELQFTPDKPGQFMISLDVEAPNEAGLPIRTATAPTLSLNVQEYKAPTIAGCQAIPAALAYGQQAKLSAQATGSPCSEIRFKWTTTEGTITNDTMANAGFDSKSVRFEQGGKIQSKSVTITGTVTDDRGATATCNTTIKVDYTPEVIRFSDLIFSKGSARVNNCAKRILLEELAAKAADPDYEIVLVGHFDQDEAGTARRPSTLDRQRVMNAIAVLTAGTGTCARVDSSRIKADWVGTEQKANFQPGVCGTSARAATDERAGSRVSTADQNRRVEVYLVPKGIKMPDSFGSAKEAPAAELKKLGCPR